MNKKENFEKAEDRLTSVTAVAKYFRNDTKTVKFYHVEKSIDYLTEWLEESQIERDERVKMAEIILFLKDFQQTVKQRDVEMSEEMLNNFTTIHGAMTIHTAKLWADQRDYLAPSDDNMFM